MCLLIQKVDFDISLYQMRLGKLIVNRIESFALIHYSRCIYSNEIFKWRELKRKDYTHVLMLIKIYKGSLLYEVSPWINLPLCLSQALFRKLNTYAFYSNNHKYSGNVECIRSYTIGVFWCDITLCYYEKLVLQTIIPQSYDDVLR